MDLNEAGIKVSGNSLCEIAAGNEELALNREQWAHQRQESKLLPVLDKMEGVDLGKLSPILSREGHDRVAPLLGAPIASAHDRLLVDEGPPKA